MKQKFLLTAAVLLTGIFILTGCTRTEQLQAAQSFEQDLAGEIQLGDITLTVNGTETASSVVPPDPYGYYTYYEEFDGYQYYVVSVTAKNTGDSEFDPESCTVRADMPDESVAEGKLVLLDNIESDFRETLRGGMECSGYLFVLAKEEAGIPETINIYYNNKFTVKEETEQYDMQMILHVAS